MPRRWLRRRGLLGGWGWWWRGLLLGVVGGGVVLHDWGGLHVVSRVHVELLCVCFFRGGAASSFVAVGEQQGCRYVVRRLVRVGRGGTSFDVWSTEAERLWWGDVGNVVFLGVLGTRWSSELVWWIPGVVVRHCGCVMAACRSKFVEYGVCLHRSFSSRWIS